MYKLKASQAIKSVQAPHGIGKLQALQKPVQVITRIGRRIFAPHELGTNFLVPNFGSHN